MLSSVLFALVLVSTSALTVLGVLLLAGALRQSPVRAKTALAGTGDAAFLFEGATLIDATPRGVALLESLSQRETMGDWAALAGFLEPIFPTFKASVDALPRTGHARIPARKGRAQDLILDWQEGVVRLTLEDAGDDDGAVLIDRLSLHAMDDELALLRSMTESAPVLMWHESPDGRITWANAAYLRSATLACEGDAASPVWPLPALFKPGVSGRVALAARGRLGPGWFDLSPVPVESGTLVYAISADEAQLAERARRDFVQILTKTFATLPIGLAVFDRTRRLQVFNPALTDLTNLEPEFLLSRPGLEGFLNRLREKHVLPEPRDYRAWSRRLLEIESTAQAGQFEETWSLPTGQTFRVSANPHPDGALAFLIEDITSETHLNRNVRAGMDTSQSVLNQLDQAVAVFASNGHLVLTNTAFSRLWTLDGEESLAAVTLDDALGNWRSASDDPDLWNRIALLSRPGPGNAAPVRGPMRLADGESFMVEARRTSTQALMITFEALEEPALPTPRAQVLRASA